MSKFKTSEDVVNYPTVTFNPKPYNVMFALDWNATPLIPHAVMTFYPPFDPMLKELVRQPHWHVPFNLRDCERLHKWLGDYIKARRGVS